MWAEQMYMGQGRLTLGPSLAAGRSSLPAASSRKPQRIALFTPVDSASYVVSYVSPLYTFGMFPAPTMMNGVLASSHVFVASVPKKESELLFRLHQYERRLITRVLAASSGNLIVER